MRRKTRKKNKNNNDLGNNIIKYLGIGVISLAIIVIALIIYSNNINKDIKEGSLEKKELADFMNDSKIDDKNITGTKKVNSDIGKSVNESLNEYEELKNEVENENKNEEKQGIKDVAENKVANKAETKIDKEDQNKKILPVTKKEEKIKENSKNKKLEFIKPVEGECIKDFSNDKLIFSNTLQEWTTHNGIDIKADKTTVVKSAEKGIVKTIKNDPRYGLSIIVEHENGFQTVYANLLTSEFIVENEMVEKGQSLGTVGNTAAFEIADEPHLHFEIIKDSIFVDPKIYIK